MKATQAVDTLAALAQETRLAIFRLLVEAGPEGMNAGAIAEALDIPAATLSFHVAHLSRAGLVSARQESRFIFYAADFAAMDDLIAYLTENCCQGKSCLSPQPRCEGIPMKEEGRIYNVLFLCTGNSARSIMAEALLNQLGKGRFRAYSAGSHPAGSINPFVGELLAKQKLPAGEMRSKSWDEFARPGAPELDFVFTVCDNAAGEVCPVWPGQPMTAHWGVEDPAAVRGDDDAKRAATIKVFIHLKRRIELFLSLPFAKLDGMSLKKELDAIGQTKD